MITGHDDITNRLALVRRLLTEAMVRLTPDTENTTPESQAWAALADAYQHVATAEAFVAVDNPATTADVKPFRHLRAVQ